MSTNASNPNSNNEVLYAAPVTIGAGEIQFVEACHPPLVAGDYEVETSQYVGGTKQEADAGKWTTPYSSGTSFTVDAPQFTLPPADIHSVYPPANQSGKFDNSLPHVVFTRRTLPWERTLDGRPPRLGQPFPPWMALLLLTDEELETEDNKGQLRSLPVFSATKESLLRSGGADILVPDVGQNKRTDRDKPTHILNRYQKEEKSCLVLDLSVDLFRAIAPREQDIPYLAHVRQVDTGDKEVLGMNDRGWFSLLMANRMPQSNTSHRVFLISLEGLAPCLKQDWQHADGIRKLRLAVLGAWGFTCEGKNDFKEHMRRLNSGQIPNPDELAADAQKPDLGLRLPFQPFKEDSTASANDIVQAAYARGYTAFDYQMRHGEQTVSWYRGPLVPLNYDKSEQIQTLPSSSDELLRYNPETGLFDTSYAAAWQLGRLLALQNHSFAHALDRARRALRNRAESLLRRNDLVSQKLLNDAGEKTSLQDELLRRFCEEAQKTLVL